MARSLIFADDATGALEAGALLADAGLSTSVLLDRNARASDDADASVLLLPTRHLDGAAARELVLAALQATAGDSAAPIYWKTDSTLRGPIGACFQALLDVLPHRVIVNVPAYPAMGRTAKQGMLFVHGRPVAETEFANDPANPVRSSSILEAAAKGCSVAVRHAKDAGELRTLLQARVRGVIVCDAETEAEVATICDLCTLSPGDLVLAGPAGGIRYWVRRLGVSLIGPKPFPPVEKWLVVSGSGHPISRLQAQAAAALGLEVLESSREDLLAEAVAETESRAIMIFGGDTALAIWRKLGIERLTPLGEALPGVAVSRSGPWLFVTKAGGYGAADLVERVLERWKT